MTFEEFKVMIKSLDENMSIGIHGVKDSTLFVDKKIKEEVMTHGLILKGWGGIISSVKMFGRVKDLSDNDIKEIYQYAYGIGDNGEIINFLFGFPEIITNSNGEEFYLGHFERDSIGKGEEKAGHSLPLNALFDQMRLIPNSFIIGSIDSPQGIPTITFNSNPNFYANIDNKPFFDSLYALLYEKRIPNPIDMFQYEEIYAKHGINTENNLGLQQYKEYLNQKKY